MLDGAYSVAELNDEIADVLRLTYQNQVWVHGTIASISRSRNGHVYFQLVDAGDSVDASDSTGGELFPAPPARTQAPAAVIPVVLFDAARQTVNQALKRAGGAVRMTDGTRIRIRARVELYAPQGKVQLKMSAIDPAFTLALLQSERDRVVTALAAEGLLDRNASRPIPAVIERIGLVTSDGSAAMADFVHELESSALGWQVVFVHAQVQGGQADRSIAAALTALDRRQVDVIALVRGGGAKTDLAVFDSEVLARTIAGLATPVVTGIGHEIDTSVADAVAHTSLKTPTACAVHLVRHARSAVDRVDAAWSAIRDRATNRVDHLEREARTTATRVESLVRSRVVVEQHGLETRAARLSRESTRCLTTADALVADSHRRLRNAAPRGLRTAEAATTLRGSRLTALDPARLVMRGWSITTKENGQIVRSIEDVAVGESITTSTSDGSITSTVIASSPAPSSGPAGDGT